MSDWQLIRPPYKVMPWYCDSWFFKMERGWQNETYIVLSRPLTIMNNVEHIALCRKDGAVVGWSEKQKIKNELFGEERVAVELYPKESEKLDDGNVYHLWLLPPEQEVMFGNDLM